MDLHGIRKIAPEENCPLVGVGVWFRDRVSFRAGGQFSSVTIVLEPTFIFIELCSMLSLGFWISYFSKYLRLIAVIKSSQRRCSIKNLFLKILQYSKENNFIKKRHQHKVFFCEYHEIFKNTYFESICEGLLCVTLLFYLPSFSIFIRNYFFMFSFRYYATYFA